MRSHALRLLCILAALLACWSCDLSESPQEQSFVSLLVPDSLQRYQDVRILLLNPGSADTLDTLWSGPVTDPSSLTKLPTKNYTGGKVDVLIQGVSGDTVAYLVLIRYRSPGEKPTLLDLSPPPARPATQETKDTIPPIITLNGERSPDIELNGSLPDLGAACEDDVDGELEAVFSGDIDLTKVGSYELIYICEDKSGNAARPITRTVWVKRPPDTTRPVIELRGKDSITVFEDLEHLDSGAVCSDDRDGVLPVSIEGSVDTALRGVYSLVFSCADSAGNTAREIIRQVTVIRLPDPDKPILSLMGRDSLIVYQGRAYEDSGADCMDARDGSLPVQVLGSVDTGIRSAQELRFGCVDSAGNEAAQKVRYVTVVREPDSTKPIITLRGGDSVITYDQEPYVDSGGECADDRDGPRPLPKAGEVDIAVRGLYTLAFHCSDSAGNAAEAVRKVRVVRRPDTVKPVLTLRGSDSLQIIQGEAYADSGADCEDDRDGPLQVAVTGNVNTAMRGIRTLGFHCADSAGNAAEKIRKVRVIRAPDSAKPVISLRGPASVRIFVGEPYADSGADCLDDRDGNLSVSVAGTVDTGKADEYILSFNCADSAGNAAEAAKRTVTVVLDIDSLPPVLTLVGEDTIPLVSLASFVDPGATCNDDKDGPIEPQQAGVESPGDEPGYYQVRYSCVDAAGNLRTASRTLKVGLFGDYLTNIADSQIDTLSQNYNIGGTGSVCFVNEPNGNYFALVRFDMSQVKKGALKAAKLRLFAFGHGMKWPGTYADYTFRVYRVKTDWVEGTGNWYYHSGSYRNGGETWLRHYPMSVSGMAASTDPAEKTGLMGSDKAIVREANLDLVSTRKVNLFFSDRNGNSGVLPPPDALTVVELDVTDYVLSANPDADYGIVIKVFGVPAGRFMDFAARELGDGSWAPRIMLEY